MCIAGYSKKFSFNMDVVQTECRSHEDAPNKSYRVVILEKDFAKATDPNNIPEGISVRPYYRGNRVTTRNTNYDSNGRIKVNVNCILTMIVVMSLNCRV